MTLGYMVSELQERMTLTEVDLWAAYRRKHGPLSPERKFDLGSAMTAATIVRVNGGKLNTTDFLPYRRVAEEQEEELTLEKLSEAFGGRMKIGKRR
jgi:hypothetical protein